MINNLTYSPMSNGHMHLLSMLALQLLKHIIISKTDKYTISIKKWVKKKKTHKLNSNTTITN